MLRQFVRTCRTPWDKIKFTIPHIGQPWEIMQLLVRSILNSSRDLATLSVDLATLSGNIRYNFTLTGNKLKVV